jgi:hypothetical protein
MHLIDLGLAIWLPTQCAATAGHRSLVEKELDLVSNVDSTGGRA